jgi:hypothetical protein
MLGFVLLPSKETILTVIETLWDNLQGHLSMTGEQNKTKKKRI